MHVETEWTSVPFLAIWDSEATVKLPAQVYEYKGHETKYKGNYNYTTLGKYKSRRRRRREKWEADAYADRHGIGVYVQIDNLSHFSNFRGASTSTVCTVEEVKWPDSASNYTPKFVCSQR